jgi:hypothetical protein
MTDGEFASTRTSSKQVLVEAKITIGHFSPPTSLVADGDFASTRTRGGKITIDQF